MEKLTTTQREAFMMSLEMIDLLEKITSEKFEQYKAEFLEQSLERPRVKNWVEAVFDIAEKQRAKAVEA